MAYIPKAELDKIPAQDFAGPHRSYPIRNQKDVHDAASLVGRADDPAAVKAKIIEIAKRKGFDIPDAWKEGEASAPLSYIELAPQTVQLSEGATQAVEQTILREGKWKHPGAPGGELDLSKPRLDELAANFNRGVGLGGDALPFHFGHTEDKDEKSVAWGRSVKVVPDADRPGRHKMTAQIDFTRDDYKKAVLGGEYAFTSPTILFDYKDKDSGKNCGAILRNVAFTNYPFIQKMGRAQVVNLSEVALAAKDAGIDFGSGGPAQGEPNLEGLPKGYDPTELPNECQTCARLGNDCPFAASTAEADLALKQAAAGSGNCPQYVPADSQSPGGGGPADAAGKNPAAGRIATATPLAEEAQARYIALLIDLNANGPTGLRQTAAAALHGASLHEAIRAGDAAQFTRSPRGAKRGEDMTPAPHVRITRKGQGALAASRAVPPALALTDTRPMGATKGNDKMNEAQQKAMAEKLAAIEANEQKTFIAALAEEHKLPAADIKIIESAMAEGSALSVKLSEALDGADGALVQLSEHPEQAVAKPAALEAVLSTVDLSDTVTIPRAAYRAAILAAAKAERIGTQLSDTNAVDGKPADKKDEKSDDVAKRVQEERDPVKALKIARDAAEAGTI